jgi:hypothetical protein
MFIFCLFSVLLVSHVYSNWHIWLASVVSSYCGQSKWPVLPVHGSLRILVFTLDLSCTLVTIYTTCCAFWPQSVSLCNLMYDSQNKGDCLPQQPYKLGTCNGGMSFLWLRLPVLRLSWSTFFLFVSRCLWKLGRSDAPNCTDWRTSGWHCTWLFATVVINFWT